MTREQRVAQILVRIAHRLVKKEKRAEQDVLIKQQSVNANSQLLKKYAKD